MANLDRVKVAPRNQQVLNLLLQGCSNKGIGGQLSISPHTVKQHLRTLFLRSGIFDGPKRVKLARYVHDGESTVMTPLSGPQPKGKSDFDSGLGRTDQSRNWTGSSVPANR
jgi:hypothetical protein